MSNGPSVHSPISRPVAIPVRLYRCGSDPIRVRTLEDTYHGVFIHYKDKRSLVCPGKSCNCHLARLERLWKGYSACEVLEANAKFWIPVAFELTEAMELDVRGMWRRGQTWDVRKIQEPKAKNLRVAAQLIAEEDPAKFPGPFDVRACLCKVFNRPELQIGFGNPQPARSFILPTPASDDEQTSAGEAQPTRLSEGEKQRLEDIKRRLTGGFGSPAIQNGKHA